MKCTHVVLVGVDCGVVHAQAIHAKHLEQCLAKIIIVANTCVQFAMWNILFGMLFIS